jgi:hypothetical protein
MTKADRALWGLAFGLKLFAAFATLTGLIDWEITYDAAQPG